MSNLWIIVLAALLIVLGFVRKVLWRPTPLAAVADIKRAIAEGARIVDVRSREQFDAGHVQGAINVPLLELDARLAEFGDENAPIVLYCNTGQTSGRVASILVRRGFTRVFNAGSVDRVSG